MFIGTSKDIYKTAYLPEQVRNDIESVISTLDKEYGRERDVYKGDGGFVIVIDSIKELDKLQEQYSLDIRNDIFESEELLSGYIERLFIISSDFCIMTYIKEGLL